MDSLVIQRALNFSLKLLVFQQGALDMLVFLRAENGWSRFEVPIGEDQPFRSTDQSLGSDKFANTLHPRKKRGAPGGKANLLVWPGGTILGSKFISNSVCVEQGHRGMFLQESSSL